MINNTSEIESLFSMCSEAAVGVAGDKIVFMNTTAVKALGRDCTGMNADSLLPEHLLHAQSDVFVSSAVINGRKTTVTSSVFENLRVFYIRLYCEEEQTRSGSSVTTSIRTMLANFRMATERMETFTEAYDDENIKTCLRVLTHNYHQLRRLLLNMSVADADYRGDIPLATAVTDLEELCRSLTEATADFVPAGIRLSFDGGVGDCRAEVDRELIEQMLLNLLANSLQHVGKSGSVRVSVTARDGKFVVIGVNDNGEGIPMDVMPSMFERWTKGVDLNSVTGAGMGLSVVKAIAERHGGSVVVESREGKGTQVRVSLPSVCEGATLRFRNSETSYELSSLDPVLTYLSVWLPARYYGPEYGD